MTLAIAQTPGGTNTRSIQVGGEEVPAVANVLALSGYHAVLVNATNAANVKGATGQVYSVHAFNSSPMPFFIKLFNVAGVPTLGTDVPVCTIAVQAGDTRDWSEPGGLQFATGIGIAVTKGLADADVQPVDANVGVVDVSYK